MRFLMRHTQPLLPFLNLNVHSGRGCVCLDQQRAPKAHRAVAITQPSPASISTFTDSRSYHPSCIPLCSAPLLSNPHSRTLRAATRFSPTRFIPLIASAAAFPDLDSSLILGIKPYSLGIQLSKLYSGKRPSAAAKRQIRRRCKHETQDRT